MTVEFLNYLTGLKKVYRMSFGKREESTADHTWGCLLLADFFLQQMEHQVDERKIKDLLIYHDLVELEAGDTAAVDEEGLKVKEQKEKEGFDKIKKTAPEFWAEKYEKLFEEYENCKTEEAKFAHAIDKLEPMVQWYSYSDNWISGGFNEEFLRETKQPYTEDFPMLNDFFEEIISKLKEKGYI